MNPLKDISERFDEEFGDPDKRTFVGQKRAMIIKGFIRKELISLLEGLKEEIDILEKKSDAGSISHEGDEYDCTDMHVGYSEAVSDIKPLIDKLIKGEPTERIASSQSHDNGCDCPTVCKHTCNNKCQA